MGAIIEQSRDARPRNIAPGGRREFLLVRAILLPDLSGYGRMFPFILRKLFSFGILLCILIPLILGLQKSRAGSAALVMSGQRSSAAEIRHLDEQTGQNSGLFEQFLKTLKNIVLLDFGITITGQSVASLILDAFGKTLQLSVFAAILALCWGVFLGIYGYYNVKFQNFIRNINYVLMALPIFVIGLFLLWIFSLFFQWFPPGGVDSLFWFVLPGFALGIKSGAHIYFFADEFIGHEHKKSYVRTALAYGYKRQKIFSKYIFKNMALPLVSFWLLELGSYLAGAAIVEMIFSIPGIGSLLLKALMRYDMNLLVGILVLISFLIFLISIIQEIMDRTYAGYLGLRDEV